MLTGNGVVNDWNSHVHRSELIFETLIGPGQAPFGELAAALRVEARDLAFQLDYGRQLTNSIDPRFTGIHRNLIELASRARMVGVSHNFFKELSGREDDVRRLLMEARR